MNVLNWFSVCTLRNDFIKQSKQAELHDIVIIILLLHCDFLYPTLLFAYLLIVLSGEQFVLPGSFIVSHVSDCLGILNTGITQSRVYNITLGNDTIPVYCDMDTDNGGWTVGSPVYAVLPVYNQER